MPFSEFWQLYVTFGLAVLFLVVLDLRWMHGKSGEIPFKQACIQSLLWICASLGFASGLYVFLREHESLLPPETPAVWTFEFLNVYVLEKCLSVDNLFVFVVIFRYFKIPQQYHHRILYFGILGASFFRGVFIALGTALLQWQWVEIVFGLFLLYTAWQLARKPEIEYTPQKGLMRFLERRLRVTPDIHGERFFVRTPVLRATPLFLTLVFIETADVLFAVDSVPASLALSREPFIVFSANVWAILGLRSLYFVLTHAMAQLRYLHYGLAVVLALVGVKMIVHDGTPATGLAALYPLLIIVVVLGTTFVASRIASYREAKNAQGNFR